MKDLLTFLIKKLTQVSDPMIEEQDSDYVKTYTVSLSKEHIGKVIGKKGRTVNAIRNLLYLYRQANEEQNNENSFASKKRIAIDLKEIEN